MIKKKCNNIIIFADDEGDNSCTFHCELSKGHSGRHKETGMGYDKNGDDVPFILEWGLGTIKLGGIFPDIKVAAEDIAENREDLLEKIQGG